MLGFVWEIISGIFTWSVDTFGTILGRILGFLGIGSVPLFLLWIVTSTIKRVR